MFGRVAAPSLQDLVEAALMERLARGDFALDYEEKSPSPEKPKEEPKAEPIVIVRESRSTETEDKEMDNKQDQTSLKMENTGVCPRTPTPVPPLPDLNDRAASARVS